jgi:hypothetical protein
MNLLCLPITALHKGDGVLSCKPSCCRAEWLPCQLLLAGLYVTSLGTAGLALGPLETTSAQALS